MNKKKTSNKLPELAPDIQRIREQVQLDELKARHWKAQYDTAFYHMQFDKLLPEYSAFLEKLEKEREEVAQKQKEYFEELKRLSEEDLKDSGLTVEEGPGVYADGSQGGA